MSDDVQPEVTLSGGDARSQKPAAPEAPAPAAAAEAAAVETPAPATEAPKQSTQAGRPSAGSASAGQGQPQREDRPPRPERMAARRGGERREGRRVANAAIGLPAIVRKATAARWRPRRPRGDRPGGGRPFEMAPEIELEKLISDSLYLDNQAHAVVARMRDMDSGTKSQLRRLYNAVRRAVRAPESERQHHFVMLRARLAYTIARHSLRSLDALERLLLQVTRRNDARGYERFKDLFEAIVAYNE